MFIYFLCSSMFIPIFTLAGCIFKGKFSSTTLHFFYIHFLVFFLFFLRLSVSCVLAGWLVAAAVPNSVAYQKCMMRTTILFRIRSGEASSWARNPNDTTIVCKIVEVKYCLFVVRIFCLSIFVRIHIIIFRLFHHCVPIAL